MSPAFGPGTFFTAVPGRHNCRSRKSIVNMLILHTFLMNMPALDDIIRY